MPPARSPHVEAKLIYSAITSLDGYDLVRRPPDLLDEYHLFVSPVAVGGGIRVLPDGARLRLDLLGERRFANGVVHLSYRTRG